VTSEGCHVSGLFADVIELEDTDVAFAAVDASGRREDVDDEADVALMPLASPSALATRRIEPPPPLPSRSPSPMAARAHNLTPSHLGDEDGLQHTAPDERRYLRSLRAKMIELEHDGIRFAAVDAGPGAEVLEHEGLGFPDTRRFEGVVAVQMVGTLLLVVRLEALAAPPLEAGTTTVEAPLASQP
jgi:hypothetical protein